jgi:hypothetical protein
LRPSQIPVRKQKHWKRQFDAMLSPPPN